MKNRELRSNILRRRYWDRFYIHGLWPTKAKKVGNLAKFNRLALKPFLPELLDYWPNLGKSDSPYSKWEAVWFKHGTTEEQLSFRAYFEGALNTAKPEINQPNQQFR